ncbi:MAG: pyruvate kinase [Gammaproteobacteria bacterium]|nr:MAG: pyruvate kinase [Gammaproteobacteria bacterium]
MSTSEQARRTRIIATLGPASATPARIEALIRAGVDCFRLNMSHGSHDEHRQLARRVRRAAARLHRHVALLCDLCGPKIRTGRFRDGAITLADGEEVIVTTRRVLGRPGLIPSQYSGLHRDARRGQRILLDDGRIELRVLAVKGRDIRCRVVHGGLLTDHKGMNLPDTRLSTPAFTRKDREDTDLAIELEADYLALSFVRERHDLDLLHRHLRRRGAAIPVIAKIEKPEALDNIDDILEHSYGIMIARGDLGIEIPAERVPLVQERLIHLARSRNRPVIVATQMMESMIENPRPTRAEVADVAIACETSTDCVMLSGETAVGRYPVETVHTMERILLEVERHQASQGRFCPDCPVDLSTARLPVREAVSNAALSLARDLALAAIVVPTRGGTTARVIAARRPLAPIIAVSTDPHTLRRCALHWGLRAVRAGHEHISNWHRLLTHLVRHRHCRQGETALVVSGFHDDPELNEPAMKILRIG